MEQKPLHSTDWELIARILSEEATEAEQEKFQQWLAEDARHQQSFEEAKSAWERSAPTFNTASFSATNAWKGLQSGISVAPQTRPLYARRWLQIAAVIALVVGIASAWMTFNSSQKAPVMLSLESGEKTRTLELTDGSTVVLNKNSTLSYPDHFEGDLRKVSLEGEAFFDIQKDAEHPFVISTPGNTIEVLGTSFHVRAYSEEEQAEVNVKSGKVRFYPGSRTAKLPKNSLILEKGESGHWDAKRLVVSKSSIQDSYHLAWQNGELNFDNTPIPRVIEVLQKYYQVEIDIRDASAQESVFSGSFSNEPLDTLIKSISIVFDLKASSEDGKIVLE